MPVSALVPRQPSRALALRWLLGAVLLALTMMLVERYVGWAELLRPWRAMSPLALAVAASLVLASYAARAARVYDHFRPETRGRLALCLRLTLLHNLLNNLVPMRLGEASFPALLGRYFAVPMVRGIAALIWFRLTDLHVLAAAGVLAFSGGTPHGWMLALLVAWLALPWTVYRSRPLLERALMRSRAGRGWALQALEAMPADAATFWRTYGWTVVNWGLKLAAFGWLLHVLAGTGFGPSLLGALAGELSSVLPVHGLAGAGTYEAGVIAGLAPFGVGAAEALAAAVNLHLFLLGLSLLGGLWGLALGRGRGS